MRKVRVDIFKSSGKWYETIDIEMDDQHYFTDIMHDTVKTLVRERLAGRLGGMTAVVLEPYHQYSHPMMFTIHDLVGN